MEENSQDQDTTDVGFLRDLFNEDEVMKIARTVFMRSLDDFKVKINLALAFMTKKRIENWADLFNDRSDAKELVKFRLPFMNDKDLIAAFKEFDDQMRETAQELTELAKVETKLRSGDTYNINMPTNVVNISREQEMREAKSRQDVSRIVDIFIAKAKEIQDNDKSED